VTYPISIAATLLAAAIALPTAQPAYADQPAKRLFASGFGGNITLAPTGDDYQPIRGTDIQTGYKWPIEILGASGSALHPIDHDNHRAIQTEIQTGAAICMSGSGSN